MPLERQGSSLHVEDFSVLFFGAATRARAVDFYMQNCPKPCVLAASGPRASLGLTEWLAENAAAKNV
jgi:hypothetical protein